MISKLPTSYQQVKYALCGLRTGNEAITVCGHIQKGAY